MDFTISEHFISRLRWIYYIFDFWIDVDIYFICFSYIFLSVSVTILLSGVVFVVKVFFRMSFYFSVYFFSRDSQKKLHLKDVENKCVCTGTTVCSDIHSTRSYFIFCLWIVVFFYLSSGDWQPFPKLLSKTFVTFAVCCCNIEVCRSESSTLSRWKICSIFFQEFLKLRPQVFKAKKAFILEFHAKKACKWLTQRIYIYFYFVSSRVKPLLFRSEASSNESSAFSSQFFCISQK